MGLWMLVFIIVIGLLLHDAYLSLSLAAIDEKTKEFLYQKLMEKAKQLGIKKVEIVESFKEENAGEYDPIEHKIFLLQTFAGEPFLLAHEIGHHIAMTKYRDPSQVAADREARKLVESILPWWRKKFGKWVLDVHFPRKGST